MDVVMVSESEAERLLAEGDVVMVGEAERRLADGDVFGALCRLGRNNGPAFLYGWWAEEAISTEQMAEQLGGVWSGVEWPARALEEDEWLEMFDDAGFVSDPPGLPAPTEALTVYRGAATGHEAGMAWTTDPDRARWFDRRNRDRFRLASQVVVLTVDPSEVLAVSHGRNEDEVVVRPEAATRWRPLDQAT